MPHTLDKVISCLSNLSNHTIQVRTNSQYVRVNEIAYLAGDPSHLESAIGKIQWRKLEDTLQWMLRVQT
jgi:GDP-D-mannose dehydratase